MVKYTASTVTYWLGRKVVESLIDEKISVQKELLLAQELLQIEGPCICELVTHRYRWNYLNINGYKESDGAQDSTRFKQNYKVSLSWLNSIAIVPLEPQEGHTDLSNACRCDDPIMGSC
jgi:hypothetical protein